MQRMQRMQQAQQALGEQVPAEPTPIEQKPTGQAERALEEPAGQTLKETAPAEHTEQTRAEQAPTGQTGQTLPSRMAREHGDLAWTARPAPWSDATLPHDPTSFYAASMHHALHLGWSAPARRTHAPLRQQQANCLEADQA